MVSNATVPIIRFNYVCKAEEIPCDISVNRRNNIFNAVLLKAYTQVDDRLQPLVLALKKWAKARGVVDSKNNRLASECLLYFTLLQLFALLKSLGPCLSKLGKRTFSIEKALQIGHFC